jgi:hypothetical protein
MQIRGSAGKDGRDCSWHGDLAGPGAAADAQRFSVLRVANEGFSLMVMAP